MTEGDIIRVTGDHPGTHGRRFRVVKITDDWVEAIDIRKGLHRMFPPDRCQVDLKATRAHKAREAAGA
jgi:hypothetical protein